MTITTISGDGTVITGYIFNTFPAPSNPNQYFIDINALVTADIAVQISEMGAVNYLCGWLISLSSGSFILPANQFQSPIDSTQAWICAHIFQSTAIKQTYGNHIAQTIEGGTFWGLNAREGYPGLPLVPPIPATVDYIEYLEPGLLPCDSLYFSMQQSIGADMLYWLEYDVALQQDSNTFYQNSQGFGG